ncbi:hypothetical protein L2089_05070 [Paenibacillus hunanensis]|uniref:hypothetical protein n=1 Tax=Paenibacillus hunanensis TaxID=539262 RepID=UPI002025DD09|nr:hypothetical protein [Paenibacillus hunanensis]MCL9660046.1 hypothetical protein [Paenibacillus hunanensis]
MKRYDDRDKHLEWVIIMLYPIVAFIMLSSREVSASGWILLIVHLLFGLLWRNLRSVMVSSVVMWIVAIPIWLYVEAGRSAQVVANFTGSLPLIILMYMFIVFLPSLLLVSLRKKLWSRYKLK